MATSQIHKTGGKGRVPKSADNAELRKVRTFCATLAHTECRIAQALGTDSRSYRPEGRHDIVQSRFGQGFLTCLVFEEAQAAGVTRNAISLLSQVRGSESEDPHIQAVETLARPHRVRGL
jgi:hypothetical protein